MYDFVLGRIHCRPEPHVGHPWKALQFPTHQVLVAEHLEEPQNLSYTFFFRNQNKSSLVFFMIRAPKKIS